MNNPDRIKAVIVAAGRGRRFGGDLPKQFCDLDGRPALMAAIDRFSSAIGRNNIIIVIDSEMRRTWDGLCELYGYDSPQIIYGGDTRWQSVKNAVDTINPADTDVVMIHDGARPLVSVGLIKTIAEMTGDSDGVVPAVPLTDSIRENRGSCSIAADRSRFVAVQTPQAFPVDVIKNAYSLPYHPEMTDDASVVEGAGYRNITLVQGESTNIKITNPLDMAIARAIMEEAVKTARG